MRGIRDREPSRILKKIIKCILKKKEKESKTFTSNLHQKKYAEVFPNGSFYK